VISRLPFTYTSYYQNVDAIEFHGDPANLGSANVTCGIHGVPPLPTWVLGAGYGYTVIGACNTVLAVILFFTVVGIPLLLIVALFGGLFSFIWQIMGAVTLFRENMGCEELIYPLWAVSMGAIISMFCFCFSAALEDRQRRKKTNFPFKDLQLTKKIKFLI